MEFRLLGPFEVVADGRPLSLGGRQRRTLLAVLVVLSHESVSTGRIIDELWGDSPPAGARKSVQAHVAHLRRILNRDVEVLRSADGGYRLDVDLESIDSHRFERACHDGRELVGAAPREAAAILTEALAMFRGSPLAGLADDAFSLRVEASRLEERRLEAMEARLDALLAAGETGSVIIEAERLVAEHPLRERLWAILMSSLYGAGRQAEALRSHSRLRQILAEELGIEPSAALQQLEQEILEGTSPAALGRSLPAAPSRPTSPVVRNPYKGLRPFDESDSSDFFGRDDLVRRLDERLEMRKDGELTVLAGPSGAGKSSVVRAGLVPRLRERDVPVAMMFPGDDPMGALIKSIAEATGATVDEVNTAIQSRSPIVKDLLVVVDQCEELFTLSPDETVSEVFLDLVTGGAGSIKWLITVRADFLDRLLTHGHLGSVLEQSLILIPPLLEDELRAVITGPAQRVGLEVEPELVAAVIHDVRSRPTALPLLQYALTDTFVRRRGQALSLADYERAGGISGALARRAEEVFSTFVAEARRDVQRLLLQLVTVNEEGEVSRRRVARGELVGEEEAVRTILERFGTQRLFTFDQEPETGSATVEIAHEALASEWPRLRGWVDEAFDDLRMARRLAGAASEWEDSGRNASFLLGGARLAEMERWSQSSPLDLPEVGRDLIMASREAENAAERSAERRRRAVLATVSVAAVVAIGMALIAFDRAGEATTQAARAEEQARIATVRELAAASATNLSSDPELASLLALQAVEQSGEAVLAEAEEALRRAVLADRLIARVPNGGNGIAHLSPLGDSFVTLGVDETTAQVWSVDPVEELATLAGHEELVLDAVYSPDGSRIATTSFDGTVRIWDTATGESRISFEVPGAPPLIPVFSWDGSRLAASSLEGVVWVWDLESGELIRELIPPEGTLETLNLEFSPDGSILAVAPGTEPWVEDFGPHIWDVETGELITVLAGHTWDVKDVGFSPDGSRLLTGSFDATVKEWDTTTWTQLRTFFGAGTSVWDLQISADGTRVAITGNQMARVFDLETFEVTHILLGHTGIVDGVDLSPDGRLLLTASMIDGTTRLWDISEEASYELLSLPDAGEIFSAGAAFDPGGMRLAVSRGHGSVTIWEFPNGREIRTFAGPADVVDVVAYDPTGELLLVGGFGGARLVDPEGEQVTDLLDDNVFHAAFSPDGQQLITMGDRGTRLWTRPFQTEPTMLDEMSGYSIGFHPGGELVALSLDAGETGFVNIRNLVTGEVDAEIREHRAPVWKVGFSPDGRWLVTGSLDATAAIWGTADFELKHHLLGHLDQVLALAFDPVRPEVATGSSDETFRIWSLDTGELLLTVPGLYTHITYSPDGAYLAGTGPESSLIVHIRDVHELAATAERRLTRWWTPEECGRYLDSSTCPAVPVHLGDS